MVASVLTLRDHAERSGIHARYPQRAQAQSGPTSSSVSTLRRDGARDSAVGSMAVARTWPSGHMAAAIPPKTQAEAQSNGGNAKTPMAKVTTRTAAMPAMGPSAGVLAPVPT